MKRNIFGACVLVLLLSGCAIFQHPETFGPTVSVYRTHTIALPTPEQLSFDFHATQILSARYPIGKKIKQLSSQIQVEASPKRIVMVAVAGWGGEIFSIDYDGKQIHTSSLPMPKAAFGIPHVLSDFIFTYAPEKLIRKMCESSHLTFIAKPKERLFLLNNKPLIRITYSSVDHTRAKIMLHNLALNYQITIQTLGWK